MFACTHMQTHKKTNATGNNRDGFTHSGFGKGHRQPEMWSPPALWTMASLRILSQGTITPRSITLEMRIAHFKVTFQLCLVLLKGSSWSRLGLASAESRQQ